MNAPLDHWIAGQRTARQMKVHVNSLLGTDSGSARTDAGAIAAWGLYLAKTQYVSALFHPGRFQRYPIPAHESTSSLLRSTRA